MVVGPGHDCPAAFDGLAQGFESLPGELGQFVKKQHSAVGQ